MRTFLLLEGPHGSFFRKLQDKLKSKGFTCYSIAFNGGYCIDNLLHSNLFIGSLEDWPAYFAQYIEKNKITDIVLYGDKRAYHTIAINIVNNLFPNKKIRVWCFEEGYLRPGYITLEEDGNNINSVIPNFLKNVIDTNLNLNSQFNNQFDIIQEFDISNEIGNLSESEHDIVPNPMSNRVKLAIIHYLALFFLYPIFPFYNWHRSQGFTSEILGWGVRKYRDLIHKSNDYSKIQQIIHFNKKYFLLPLQLKSDYQLSCASNMRDIIQVIEIVVASFCKNAPTDSMLVVKLHPLDNTFINYRKFVCKFSSVFKCSERIFFITHFSNNKELIANSQGVVVVNSTVGISALEQGIPTLTLGKAIYNADGLAQTAYIDGLIKLEILDQFWRIPIKPNPIIVKCFFDVLHEKSLIKGNFYTKKGIEQALDNVLKRLDIHGIRNCIILSKGILKIPNLDIFLKNVEQKCVIGWGHKKTSKRSQDYAKKYNLPYIALEDGFIRSIGLSHRSKSEQIISIVMDRIGIYYDATMPSELEKFIETSKFWMNSQIESRAKKLINLIVNEKIVKYNLIKDEYKESERHKNKVSGRLSEKNINHNQVLVVDQTCGDAAVTFGNAAKRDFEKMLDEAVSKFGVLNVTVKVHPDTFCGKARGYFSVDKLKKKGVKILYTTQSSMEIFENFKNVYVVTSGMGFEALMFGCNVTCYGEPFYSGWGLTDDKKSSSYYRRIEKIGSKISIETLVAAVFFKYSIFINPKTRDLITPEEAINYIVNIKYSSLLLKNTIKSNFHAS